MLSLQRFVFVDMLRTPQTVIIGYIKIWFEQSFILLRSLLVALYAAEL